nr:hypothetical protein [Tanacetum cinerariifolium]
MAFPAAAAAVVGCGWRINHHRRGGAYKTPDFLGCLPPNHHRGGGRTTVQPPQPHLVVSSCDGATPWGVSQCNKGVSFGSVYCSQHHGCIWFSFTAPRPKGCVWLSKTPRGGVGFEHKLGAFGWADLAAFWNTIAIKHVNDVTRLQALVDKKIVIVTEAAIREKVFTNIGRVGKGFSRVDTPLFEGMLVAQEIEEEGDADEYVEEVTAGDAAHGDDTAAHGEVPTITQEPSIPSPTPPTPPPQPPQALPLTSQVQQTPPQSPQVQPPSPPPLPQPQQAADFPMSLLQEALDACAALTRRVEHLEYDKVAQALEITKLKRRGRMIAEMDKDDAVVLMDDKEEDKKVKEAKVVESTQVQERKAESQAEIYKIDMDHANKVLSMQEDKTEPAEVQEVVDVVTTAKLITEVVTAASETITDASAIIPSAEPQVPAAILAAAKKTWRVYGIWLRRDFLLQKPKNFSDDFMLTTLEAMFETSDAHAQIWKNQRSVHGQAGQELEATGIM